MSARIRMPAAPFAELCETYLRESEREGIPYSGSQSYVELGVMAPLDLLTERVASAANLTYETASRRIYDLRHGVVGSIGFDLADAIVCVTVGPYWWYVDERVRDLYQEIGSRELARA